ncbi:hypothetical protein HANVADRAFT_60300 [Hanseniaspora valbyensis NRRL Y-1626]|uniref:Uncharacterized protein n=1 Tax=Hanseniaspora valbyensis NRRL Y-1626 TaxID=766949 RepID=A0A1B7T8V5_9ASCO|nr:hypothetical protein HANVADRAFT_60300 [Hanseniaspora valbyensis NRRL Y-1626]
MDSSSNTQTKLQQDRIKLKEFYSKQKQVEDDKLLKCRADIAEVKENLDTAIAKLKTKNENIDMLAKQMDSIYEVYEKIDDQIEHKKFKAEIKSLLSDLK